MKGNPLKSMDYLFVIAAIVAALFFAFKSYENRSLPEEEQVPTKSMVRDSVFLFTSVIFSSYFVDQIKSMIGPVGGAGGIAAGVGVASTGSVGNTLAFTDNPNF